MFFRNKEDIKLCPGCTIVCGHFFFLMFRQSSITWPVEPHFFQKILSIINEGFEPGGTSSTGTVDCSGLDPQRPMQTGSNWIRSDIDTLNHYCMDFFQRPALAQ